MKISDVLIIGAGIIGTSTAYFLSKQGIDLIVLDKSFIGKEASGVNAGSLMVQNKEIDLIPIAKKSISIWKKFHNEISEEIEFSQPGGLIVAENGEQLNKLKKQIMLQRKAGLDVNLINPEELRNLEPNLSNSVVGASYCKIDGFCNTLKATILIANAARSFGTKFNLEEKVIGIDFKKNKCFTVYTTKEKYKANRLVICAGVWSDEILKMLGINIPIQLSPQQVMVTETTSSIIIRHVISHVEGNLTLKQSNNGNVIIGGGWEAEGDKKKNIKQNKYTSIIGNSICASRVVSSLKYLSIIRCWAGLEGRSLDKLPILGNPSSIPGLFIACCTKGGFTIGPALGSILADMIIGSENKNYFDKKFDVNRFIKS